MKTLNFEPSRLLLAISIALGGGMSAPLYAQEADITDAKEIIIEEVTVLGSRRSAPRSAMDAAVPVDVVSSAELLRQGSTNVIDALTSIIPSLNANREPISDVATLVRPVNLRSLASDQTLVLVNGKRRHRSATVAEFASGINKGAQGVDVAPLFGAALKQVEVLRDGAAAQYGSDAIAGVINFSLQDDPTIRTFSAQYGEAYEGDGETYEISGAFGMPLASDGGFAVLSYQIKDSGATGRGVQDGGAAALAAAGFPIADPVVVWGAPNVTDDYKLFINAGVPIGDNGTELYWFGNYATRKVDGSFYYRNPTSRDNVFVVGDGGEPSILNVLFADSTGQGCPVAPLPTSSFADAQAFIANAPDNCFAFQSRHPGGFTPRFGGKVTDYSIAGGVRGEFSNGLSYDVSFMNGENRLGYQISNTLNASLGEASPSEFYIGSHIENDTVLNADFSKGVEIDSLASDLNVAFGFQYQDENYEIAPGQVESYIAGPLVSQLFSAGSNGFQGFGPKEAGKFSRNSSSLYLDLEADITDKFLMSAAVRYEDFSDFGDTTNGKLAARYAITDALAVRGAISSGFRAPSLGQSNLQRAATNIRDGKLVEGLTISSTNPIAQRFGGKQLEPEKAENLSLGIAVSIGKLDLTVDYFDIDISDRITQIRRVLMQSDRDSLVASGSPEAATVSEIAFFVNDFDTNTSGIDIVANYPLEWANSSTDVTLAINFTDTKVTKRGSITTDARVRELEDSIPERRATLTFDHNAGPLSALLRINYFGEAFELLFTDVNIPVETDSLVMVDAEVGWQFSDTISLALGAKNIFDTYPDEWTIGETTGRTPGYVGAIYPLNHPAGLGGGHYYMRLTADF